MAPSKAELRASRARILQAGDAERQRIERDLHDSAQQRLVALRIHLTLAGEQLERSDERAMLERLGVEVDHAIDELRTVARGVYPHLRSEGVGAALADVGRRAAIPVTISGAWPPLAGSRDDRVLLLPRVPPERCQARRPRGLRRDPPR